ncbi:MAG: hypothetical protein ACRDHZ_13815 [Ktedonobacteraceae bacterium]
MSTQPAQPDLGTMRIQAQAIAERVKTDPAFVKALVNDPKATLVAAGLPDPVASDVLNSALTDEQGCGVFSCVTTACCLSISVCCQTHSC